MNIEIRSGVPFSENLYDAAFGMAKSMIINSYERRFSRKGDFVLTARLKNDSVIVKIQEG